MSITEVRPFPVHSTVVMRGTLFALANLGATLHTYNEESGVIVASVSKWMGLQKNEVVARVRDFERTCQLELETPDVAKAHELFSLIASYVSDGAKVKANATIQWVDMARQQASQARRRDLVQKAKALLPGSKNDLPAPESSETALVPAAEGETAVALSTSTLPPIPDNPGVLVKKNNDKLIELKVSPEIFTDRTAFLVTCNQCAAVSLRGSTYCATCGRPLTLDALQANVSNAAGTSLTSSLIGLALHVVPLLILVLPAIFIPGESSFLDRVGAGLDMVRIGVSFILGILPATFFGWRAISQGQRASWYLNLGAKSSGNGRTKATLGNALGWLTIYLSVAWVIFILIALV